MWVNQYFIEELNHHLGNLCENIRQREGAPDELSFAHFRKKQKLIQSIDLIDKLEAQQIHQERLLKVKDYLQKRERRHLNQIIGRLSREKDHLESELKISDQLIDDVSVRVNSISNRIREDENAPGSEREGLKREMDDIESLVDLLEKHSLMTVTLVAESSDLVISNQKILPRLEETLVKTSVILKDISESTVYTECIAAGSPLVEISPDNTQTRLNHAIKKIAAAFEAIIDLSANRQTEESKPSKKEITNFAPLIAATDAFDLQDQRLEQMGDSLEKTTLRLNDLQKQTHELLEYNTKSEERFSFLSDSHKSAMVDKQEAERTLQIKSKQAKKTDEENKLFLKQNAELRYENGNFQNRLNLYKVVNERNNASIGFLEGQLSPVVKKAINLLEQSDLTKEKESLDEEFKKIRLSLKTALKVFKDKNLKEEKKNPVELSLLCDNVVERFQKLHNQASSSFELNLTEGLPTMVNCVEDKLEILLDNIILFILERGGSNTLVFEVSKKESPETDQFLLNFEFGYGAKEAGTTSPLNNNSRVPDEVLVKPSQAEGAEKIGVLRKLASIQGGTLNFMDLQTGGFRCSFRIPQKAEDNVVLEVDDRDNITEKEVAYLIVTNKIKDARQLLDKLQKQDLFCVYVENASEAYQFAQKSAPRCTLIDPQILSKESGTAQEIHEKFCCQRGSILLFSKNPFDQKKWGDLVIGTLHGSSDAQLIKEQIKRVDATYNNVNNHFFLSHLSKNTKDNIVKRIRSIGGESYLCKFPEGGKMKIRDFGVFALHLDDSIPNEDRFLIDYKDWLARINGAPLYIESERDLSETLKNEFVQRGDLIFGPNDGIQKTLKDELIQLLMRISDQPRDIRREILKKYSENRENPLGGLEALMVASDPAETMKLRTRLQSEGFKIHQTSQAANITKAVQDFPGTDLIIVDSKELGSTITKPLSTLREQKHLPIIVMTASRLRGDREYLRNIGIMEIMDKPTEPDDVLSAIRTMLVANFERNRTE